MDFPGGIFVAQACRVLGGAQLCISKLRAQTQSGQQSTSRTERAFTIIEVLVAVVVVGVAALSLYGGLANSFSAQPSPTIFNHIPPQLSRTLK